MKENICKRIEVPINNPNDRSNLVLLKYLKGKTKKEERQYDNLSKIYPDNEYFQEDIINKLLLLKLMDKDIFKAESQDHTGQVFPAEFIPTTNHLGREALKNLFPSEYKERDRTLHQYRINKGGFWIAVIGGVSGIVSITAVILQFI